MTPIVETIRNKNPKNQSNLYRTTVYPTFTEGILQNPKPTSEVNVQDYDKRALPLQIS